MTDYSVTVTSVEPVTDGLRIGCDLHFDHTAFPYFGPLAPSNLFEDVATYDSICQFHRTVTAQKGHAVFERFDALDPRVPEIGKTYFLQLGWSQEFMEAVLDTTAEWRLLTYPDNGDHDHSLFTWDTLAAYGDGHRQGYFNEIHGWATVEAYEAYVRDDIYRLRQPRS